MNDHTACWRMILQIRDYLILLRTNRLQCRALISPTYIWRQACTRGIRFNLSNQLLASLLLQFANLSTFQNRAHRICSWKQSSCPTQNRTQPLSVLETVVAWIFHLALNRDRLANV